MPPPSDKPPTAAGLEYAKLVGRAPTDLRQCKLLAMCPLSVPYIRSRKADSRSRSFGQSDRFCAVTSASTPRRADGWLPEPAGNNGGAREQSWRFRETAVLCDKRSQRRANQY